MIVQRALEERSLFSLIGWVLQRMYRQLTSPMRTLPDYVIIGGQRCGTTSLYNYLITHPRVAPAFIKETHFFTRHYRRGMNWYRANFPLSWYKDYAQRIDDQSTLSGEATPYYLFYPHTARRAAEVIPDSKIIALLRNPVDRAYSHYHHAVRQGLEKLSFEDALQREQLELPDETEKVMEDADYQSAVHQAHSYLARGRYVDQLESWYRYFDKQQILVLKSEDLNEHPSEILERVREFLNLSKWQPALHTKYHVAQYDPMDPGTRERLEEYFGDYNRRLYELLGRDFHWQSQDLRN